MNSPAPDAMNRPETPTQGDGADPVLHVDNLRVEFPGDPHPIRVVDGVSFELRRGEVLGVVGESGSGKTMTARSLLGLVPSRGRVSGRIAMCGHDVSALTDRAWAQLRGSTVGMVFQDAMSGLNPVRTVGSILVETIRGHQRISPADARRRAVEVLGQVGIPAPEQRFRAYPHQLSGGMRQRVMIAFAIVNEPAVVVADEPTTALDATVQAQIADRLRTLVHGSGLILITHDLGVASMLCDRVLVMYAGRVAEVGTAETVLTEPRHPYTAGLLGAVPRFDRNRSPLRPIPGAPPRPADLGAGCPFAPRCRNARHDCYAAQPPLAAHDDRLLACYHPVGGDS